MRAVAEVERRYRSNFIEEIIQEKISSRADVLSRGESYGWDLSFSFIPLLVEIDNYRNFYSVKQKGYDHMKVFKRLESVVSLVTSIYKEGAIAVDIGARILILLKAEADMCHKSEMDMPQKFLKKIQEEMLFEEDLTISVGIGQVVEDIMDLKNVLTQATQALEIGQLLHGPDSITHFNNLGVYRILFSCQDKSELIQFCDELLGDLIKGDQLNNTELVKTLEILLQCNFNLKEASRTLFIHYNTLRYRVTRIQEIAKVDLRLSEDRLNLQLALRILRMQ